MKTLRITTISFLIFVIPLQLYAQQQPNAVDSIIADTSQEATAAYLLQQKQQERVDSVVAAQIQTELKEAAIDERRKRELEKQLQEIAIQDSLRNAEKLARVIS